MRVGAIAIILALVCVGGCQKKRPAASTVRHWAQDSYIETSREPALAMDPPITQGNPRLMLARDVRERGAFMGYESSTTTFFWVRMDDRQTEDGRNDRLDRRAISVKVGTSSR